MKLLRLIKKDTVKIEKACRITPKMIRHKWLALYSLILLFSHILLGVSYYAGNSLISENPKLMASNIIQLTNNERSKNQLGSLTENESLDKAAQDKLDDMFKNNYWDHFSPTGAKPWDFMKNEKYEYVYAGENLAKGFVESDSTVDAWMNSESHKNNILNNNFKDIGVAVGSGNINGKPTTLVVQMFGAAQVDTITPRVAGEKVELTSATKENKMEFNPSFSTFVSRLPFLLLWFVIFCLIVFDGVIIRRCGLHASRKHLFEFRSALLINGLVLLALSINMVAIS